MERVLKKEKLLETAERLSQRIGERFPNSGLSRVAAEVVQVTKEALVRAERIKRPNLWLRAGLVLLAVIAVVGIVRYLQTYWAGHAEVTLFQFLDETKGAAAYLAAIALFLVTLEVRFKRRRALQAIHELRAMAHIIDMHQLAKDPDRLGTPGGPLLASGRVMSADDMGHYLNYSTELLALVSKIGQLYVEGFADATVLAAADQFENLATGLSSKIWQKIMILERIRSDVDARGDGQPRATRPTPAAEAAPGAKVPEAPAS
jgi:hypothetical protein